MSPGILLSELYFLIIPVWFQDFVEYEKW
jgi:hypothetical protein